MTARSFVGTIALLVLCPVLALGEQARLLRDPAAKDAYRGAG